MKSDEQFQAIFDLWMGMISSDYEGDDPLNIPKPGTPERAALVTELGEKATKTLSIWDNQLSKMELKVVLVGWEMSTEHLGGDDLIDYIKSALEVERAGYHVLTWYGPKSEVVVVGIKE
jgi:hypothetical protein